MCRPYSAAVAAIAGAATLVRALGGRFVRTAYDFPPTPAPGRGLVSGRAEDEIS
ncbi:hypothetical protein [Kitasatospora sp. P5_F3]